MFNKKKKKKKKPHSASQSRSQIYVCIFWLAVTMLDILYIAEPNNGSSIPPPYNFAEIEPTDAGFIRLVYYDLNDRIRIIFVTQPTDEPPPPTHF